MDCSSPWSRATEAYFFWTGGVALVITGALGIIGSCLILLVLGSSDLKKKVFYKLLIALAVFDLLFILSYVSLLSYRVFSCNGQDNMFSKLTYPLLNISLTGSIYMTMAISLERYLGICHPMAGPRRSSFYIFPVLLVSVIFNFPRFLEKTFDHVENTSPLNISMIVTEPFTHPHLSDSSRYKTAYYMWAATIFLSIIPLLSLFYLNGSIIWKIYKSSVRLENFSHNYNKDPKATNILLVTVGAFLACHTPRILYKLLFYFDYNNNFWLNLTPISQLALVFNSAVNFFIYCLIGDNFKLNFYQLVKCQGKNNTSVYKVDHIGLRNTLVHQRGNHLLNLPNPRISGNSQKC